MAYLYRHLRNDTGNIFYIGIGSDEKFSRAKETSCRNKHWKNVVNKHGFTYEIMLTDLTWDEACKKEIEFISFYGRHNLVNLTDGGQGTLGREVSQKTREIMRLRKTGAKHSPESIAKCKARVCPESVKKTLSDLNKGKKIPESTREKLRDFNKGKSLSEEHKRKIGESRKGKNLGYVPSEQARINMKAAAARKRIRILIQKEFANA